MHSFLELKFKAIICHINSAVLPESFLGREVDSRLLEDLPPGIDPAGENGEFHTFCFGGPVFKKPVEFITGVKHFTSLTLGAPGKEIIYSPGYLDIL